MDLFLASYLIISTYCSMIFAIPIFMDYNDCINSIDEFFD